MRFYYFSLLIFSFVLLSCRKEKAVWDSNWVAPLVNDTLRFDQLVADSILELDGSGNYQLGINRNILDINLSEYIQIPDTVVVQKYAIAAGSILVQPGTSFVNNNKDHVFDIQGAELKKVMISEGRIKVTVQNPIETKTLFTVTLPKTTKNGIPISNSFQAPAGTNAQPSEVSAIIDLSGYEIDLTGSTGGGFNLLQSQMVVQSDPTGVAVNLNNYDTTKFIIQMEGLKLSYGRGYFGNLTIEDTTDYHVDFLDKFTSGLLDLPATNIQFVISNGIKVSARATLNEITNTNSTTGNTVSLAHAQIGVPFIIQQATGTWDAFFESIKTLIFSSANSNVEQFIENLGSSQRIRYKFELNPYGNISGGWDEFFPTSRLKVLMKAEMPLSASMTNLTFQDTFALNLAQDANKTHVVEGKLKMEVANAFPLQGTMELQLLDAFGNVIQTISGSEPILSSIYGSQNVNGLAVSHSELWFDLDEATITQLSNVHKVAVKAVMNTPDLATSNSVFVTVPEGAFMGIKIGSSFKLQNKF